MLGGADNPNGELPSYITGADIEEREIPELVDLKALLSSCRWSIREFSSV